MSCLIAAATLHVAVPVAAHLLPTPLHVRPLFGTRFRSAEIDVDVVTEPMRWSEPRTGAPSLGFGVHRYVPPGSRERPPDMPPDSAVPPEETELPPIEPDLSPTGEPMLPPRDYDAPPTGWDTPGGSGWPGGSGSWALLPSDMPKGPEGEPAPTRPGARRAVDTNIAGQVIERAMTGQDRTLGLDLPAASAVAGAVAAAVRASETPWDCSATLSVALGGDGKIQSVTPAGYSCGTASDWRGIAKAVQASAGKKGYTMKSAFAKGAIVTVNVRSQMAMPSGDGGRQGLGFTFDPTNIGARPTRKVTTSVSVQAIR